MLNVLTGCHVNPTCASLFAHKIPIVLTQNHVKMANVQPSVVIQ